MLPVLIPLAVRWAATKAAQIFGLKPLKHFIDSTFREMVRPVPGSVVYCDLWLVAEHSGIFLGDARIANIEVDGFAESTVRDCGPESFTSKSTLSRKIYVSCDGYGPVGDKSVARAAAGHVGERGFYGLLFKNCHQFSTQCVNYAGPKEHDPSLLDRALMPLPDETSEPTMAALKRAARDKLGATKWRLWDWQSDEGETPEPSSPPDWQAHESHFENLPLDVESISRIREEASATQAYEEEIADENVPAAVRQRLKAFRKTLTAISTKYDEVKDFLASCPDARFSYADLKACKDDFSALAAQLQGNDRIKELARKMGRDYTSEARKRKTRVPQPSKSEVYGTYRSDDLMRVLPSELLNLEDETLETVFYARLLEHNLLTYELQGATFVEGEEAEQEARRTGPVVACLDTSGSMEGAPTIRAKALLLAIANILKAEHRSLHVLLFGSSDELAEFSMAEENNAADLLKFLARGYGGGTDFATPLTRAISIISEQKDYKKADVLMITDGHCNLSSTLCKTLMAEKVRLDFSIYSVLCGRVSVEDEFSDETVVL